MRSPSRSTVKKLFALSGNRCAFSECLNPLVDGSGTVTGEICHIRGRKKGSARFDPSQTDEERHGFDNLVLMCPSHHTVIDDNEEVYTVEALLEIKRKHETHSEKVEEPTDQVAQQLIANIEAHGRYNIHVVSHNQSGGITAGIVNINAAPEPTLEWQEVFVNRLV